MPTYTTNYNLSKPLVNNPIDQNLWGNELNSDLDIIDPLLKAGITIATQSSQTSNFSASSSISIKYLYPCDATGGNITVTIPAAATAANGATIYFKKTDSSANTITLTRSGSDTIDGATTVVISAQYDVYGMVSDGVSAWNAITKSQIQDATTSIKGIVQLATASEVLAGSSTTKVSTPSALAGNKSLSANGYYKFPGGLVMQWGTTTITSNTQTITFPTSFSSSCYNVIISHGSSVAQALGAINLTTTTFDAVRGGSTNETIYWTALGV